METTELKVLTEAVRWWKNKRPIEFNESQHLDNPMVNCPSNSDCRLAVAVSKLIKSKQLSSEKRVNAPKDKPLNNEAKPK